MDGIKGLLIDVDGTLCLGDSIIPGTAEIIEKIRLSEIPFLVLSNNSSMSSEEYLGKLHRLGFNLKREELLTATEATVFYLKEKYPDARVMPLGMSGFVGELIDGGINIVDDSPDVVLLAYDKTINFDKLNKAGHYIKQGSVFLATHPDMLCNSSDGYDIDIGAFIMILEKSTGVKATIIGKPEDTMARLSMKRLNLPAKDIAVIGDRLYTDIAFANKNKMQSVLVLSGEATVSDLKDSQVKPDYIIGSILDLDKVVKF